MQQSAMHIINQCVESLVICLQLVRSEVQLLHIDDEVLSALDMKSNCISFVTVIILYYSLATVPIYKLNK